MKKKSLLRKILFSALIFTLVISNVNAVTVEYVDRDNTGFPQSDYPIIENDAVADAPDTYVGGGEIFEMSDGNEAYCIDPGANTPLEGATFVVDNSELDEKYIKGFASICQQTIGMDDIKRITALKAYSVISGAITHNNSATEKYKRLVEVDENKNPNAVWNEAKFGKFDIVGVIKTAQTAETASGTSYTITNNGNNIYLNTSIPMEVSIGSGYELNINGSPVVGSSTNLNSGSYTIKVKSSSASCSGSVEVAFKYDETYSNTSGVTVYKGPGDYQRLLACNDAPGSCDGGVCTQPENISLTCAPTCPDNPDVDFPGVNSSGNAICKADGQTVVVVNETPNGLNATESEISCIEDDEHKATDVIMGTSNDYCQIYCTENYELVLPGPDRANGDPEVFINAGSYFTIDEKDAFGNSTMYDVNTITCYGKMDYNKLKTDINTLRNNVVNAYNEWSYQDALVNAHMVQGYTQDANGNSVPAQCQASKDYKFLTMGSDGEIKSITKFYSQMFTGACPTYDASSSEKIKLSTLKGELDKEISAANTEIQKISGYWDTCLNWKMDELINLYEDDEDCNAKIDFTYADVAVDVVVADKSTKDNGGSTINNSSASSTINVGVCDNTGSNCNKQSTYNTNYKYINRQVEFTTNYKFNNGMVIDYETGSITMPVNENNKPDCVATGTCSDVIKGFPISLDTPQGIGTYEYAYSNIGHNFDAMSSRVCSMGRFDNDINLPSNYGCYYDVNNCEDCKVTCTGTGCNIELPDCKDGACKVACVGGGCIVDVNAGFLATYRTISLNDLRFAYNTKVLSSEPAKLLAVASTKEYSSKTNNTTSNWGTPKGDLARNKITTVGETIYEADPEYKVTLTPAIINEIRNYNKDAEDAGKGYLNDTLTCKDNLGAGYGQCESSFISDPDFQIKRKNGTLNFEAYSGTIGAFEGPAWK